jgi:hypothetical protein
MSSRSIALIFAMTFAVAAVSAVSVTFFSDANCATKATLPGGVSNPVVTPLNSCAVLGSMSMKYTTCSSSAGITQQDYSDTSCNTKDGNPTVIPGSGIGLCVPFPGVSSGIGSVKMECSSSSALNASVLGVVATMIALLL